MKGSKNIILSKDLSKILDTIIKFSKLKVIDLNVHIIIGNINWSFKKIKGTWSKQDILFRYIHNLQFENPIIIYLIICLLYSIKKKWLPKIQLRKISSKTIILNI